MNNKTHNTFENLYSQFPIIDSNVFEMFWKAMYIISNLVYKSQDILQFTSGIINITETSFTAPIYSIKTYPFMNTCK